MLPRAKTDGLNSISSREFEWTQAGTSDSHNYLALPTIGLLKRFGARTVLDLGCGNGAFTGLVAASGFLVHGCDASSSGIQIARVAFPEIPLFQHDLSESLPSGHHCAYDAVVSVEVIEHLLLPRTLMTNAFQALRPGGVFIVSTPFHGYWKNLALAITNKFDNHWHPLRDYGHVKFFSKRTLFQLFVESGFQVKVWLAAGRTRLMPCSMIVAAQKPDR
jgi:2-polyprenyl-6-hydroxyphenyl methylase/3-demethylubiquinone-9 3-methyltransferase